MSFPSPGCLLDPGIKPASLTSCTGNQVPTVQPGGARHMVGGERWYIDTRNIGEVTEGEMTYIETYLDMTPKIIVDK